MEYTYNELMVAAAAREIKPKNVVFVGMRLPLLSFLLAKELYAHDAYGVFENGVIRDIPAKAPLLTMGDLPNLTDAVSTCGMNTVMSLLATGRIDVGFIGGAEIDRFGNLNTNYIGDVKNPEIRLPGSGGACDIAAFSKKLLVIINHEKRRFKEKVDFITSPGFGNGGNWRGENGLKWGGPSAIITTLCIFKFYKGANEIFLASLHPGITVEKVIENTGFEFKIPENVEVTPPPTKKELLIIRKYDPEGFWTGGKGE